MDIGETTNFSKSLKIVDGVTIDAPASCSFNVSSDEVGSYTSRECSIVILGVQHFERNYIPIIGLHAIEDNIERPADLLTRYFNNLCSTLKTFGFETITFMDILNYIDYGKALPEKPVIITSDDGFQDIYINAFPILKEYDYRMTVFLVTGVIGNSEADRHVNEFDINRRIPIRPMLIWPEIVEISSYGCEFLSHTVNHIRLGLASDEDVLYELVQSKEDIESHLGKPILFFSWPYDNYSVSKQYLLSQAGYRGAVRYGGGIEDMRTINLYNIKRVEFNGYIIPREYANYLGLGGIKIDYKVDEFYKEAGEEFTVEYIIRNNIEENIKITSLELELSDSIEFIGIEPDGYIDQEPGLSDEVYMWVSDNYIVKSGDDINLILKLKGTEGSKSTIKFRASSSGVYIDCDDIEIEIRD
ncbi:MAG: polysaccharide deacetylase family protein [Actinobacteria bacterium]|nr:polysaccharide deacetylase family protein [Actinomycetota bacterium]